ncbi:DUF6157 family protein [Chryseobacterium carnipullorum]|nr:DUF6157 family protein [Chryseobacterium carnipullorum]
MIHTTNYINTFIEIADDCTISHAETPPEKKTKTLASLQYEQIKKILTAILPMTLYLNVMRSKIIFLKVKSSRKKHSFFSKG